MTQVSRWRSWSHHRPGRWLAITLLALAASGCGVGQIQPLADAGVALDPATDPIAAPVPDDISGALAAPSASAGDPDTQLLEAGALPSGAPPLTTAIFNQISATLLSGDPAKVRTVLAGSVDQAQLRTFVAQVAGVPDGVTAVPGGQARVQPDGGVLVPLSVTYGGFPVGTGSAVLAAADGSWKVRSLTFDQGPQ